MLTLDRCPVCGGTSAPWRRVDSYRLDCCATCGFVYVNPRPDRTWLSDMYRTSGGHCGGTRALADVLDEERRAPNSTADAARIVARLVSALGAPGRLLDVGCGYGLFSAEAQRRGFEVEALEIAPGERAAATELLGRAPLPLEFEDYDAPPGSFDAILMSQILEHVVDPAAWAAKAAHLLRRGGVLCVAVPSFDSFLRRALGTRDPYVDPPVHLNYFGRGNLELLLVKKGFEVLRTDTVSRIRADAVSRRLRLLPAGVKRAITAVVRVAQLPPLAVFDAAGLGIFLNVYARACHGSDTVQRASA